MRFLIQPFDPEAVVFDQASGDTHYLSPLALAIYSVCHERPGITLDTLSPYFARRLDRLPDPDLDAEIRGILNDLRQIGLVTP